jgi:hypothetical protein
MSDLTTTDGTVYTTTDAQWQIGRGKIPIDEVEDLLGVLKLQEDRIEVLMDTVGIMIKKITKMDEMIQELYYPYKTKGE